MFSKGSQFKGGKTFFYPFRLRIKLTQNRLTEKRYSYVFNIFMWIQEASGGKWRTEEISMPKGLYTFYTCNDKLGRCDKTKGLGLGTVNCETVGLPGQVHFSVKFQFLVIKMFFFSGTGRISFSWKILTVFSCHA